VRFCLTCVIRKTHGKVDVCRAPDEVRTANILTHGNLPFSRSVPSNPTILSWSGTSTWCAYHDVPCTIWFHWNFFPSLGSFSFITFRYMFPRSSLAVSWTENWLAKEQFTIIPLVTTWYKHNYGRRSLRLRFMTPTVLHRITRPSSFLCHSQRSRSSSRWDYTILSISVRCTVDQPSTNGSWTALDREHPIRTEGTRIPIAS
jgi:hypothetical protein